MSFGRRNLLPDEIEQTPATSNTYEFTLRRHVPAYRYPDDRCPWFRHRSISDGMALGKEILSPQTWTHQKFNLRVWPRIEARCLPPVQAGILPLRNRLLDLRCRGNLPTSVRSGIHRPYHRRIHRHADLPAVIGRRPGLDMAKGHLNLGMKNGS